MTCKYFYCYRIYICVKNIVIFYAELKKNFSLFSLPDFHKHPRTFFQRGWGNSLKGTYVEGEGRLPEKLTGMDKRNHKLEVSSETTF